MSDIFREVDEEVRIQKLNDIWKKYGSLLVALVVLILAAVGGWRYYQHLQLEAAAESSGKFEAALQLARDGKVEDAEKAFGALSLGGAGGYKILARFREAAELAKRDGAAAVKIYDAIAIDASIGATLQSLAKVRAAALLVDSVSADELVSRIGGLSVPGQAWRHTARELLGLARYKAGDMTAASGYFEQVALDPETPPQMRQRAEIMLGLARGGVVPIK